MHLKIGNISGWLCFFLLLRRGGYVSISSNTLMLLAAHVCGRVAVGDMMMMMTLMITTSAGHELLS